jgi:hypothetical protein
MWGVDWIDLAHDRGRWRAFVNAVLNLGKMRGISLLAEHRLASQGLCPMEYVMYASAKYINISSINHKLMCTI